MTDYETQTSQFDKAVTEMLAAAETAASARAKLGADADLVDLSQALLEADFSGDSQIRNSLREQLLAAEANQSNHRSEPVANSSLKGLAGEKRGHYGRRLMTAATIAALIVFAFLAIPQLRSWAQDVIDGLFNRATSDSMESETYRYIPPSITPTPNYRIFDNIAAAEMATGHDIVTPSLELAAYWRDEVKYFPDSGLVWLNFASPPGRQMWIIMYPLDYQGFGEDEVAASAEIIPVQINGLRGTFEGEFVAGGWSISSEEVDRLRSDPAYSAGETVSTTVEWLPDMPVRRLRWQQGDWIYEITAWGGDGDFPGRDLMMEDLIALAESMR